MTKRDWLRVRPGDVVEKIRASWAASPNTIYWSYDDPGFKLRRA